MTTPSTIRWGDQQECENALRIMRFGEPISGTEEAISSYVRTLECAVDAFLIGDSDIARRMLNNANYDMNRALTNTALIDFYLDAIRIDHRQEGA